MKKFFPIILWIFVVGSFAQSNTQTILVDEFGKMYCDEFLARTDNFAIQLRAQPSSIGYFVISGDKKYLREKLRIELMFEPATQYRGPNRTEAKIIRGRESGPLKVQMWIASPNSKTPDFGETKWDLRIPTETPPLNLRTDMEQICAPAPIGQVAKDLLDANPNGSIFVVVHGATFRERQRELRLAKKMLKLFDPARVRYLLRQSGVAYSDYYFAIGNPPRTAFKSDF